MAPGKLPPGRMPPTLTLTQTLTQVGICWVAFVISKIDYLTQIKTEKQLFQVFFKNEEISFSLLRKLQTVRTESIKYIQ